MQKADQSSSSSQSLAQQIVEQDQALLQQLYTENYPGVETYVLKNSGDADDARDCYQDSFLAVWRNIQLGKFQPARRDEFAAYLFQVAKFKWIDQLRARKIRPMVSTNDLQLADEMSTATDDEETKKIGMVREHFSKLGSNCRELLRRFYFEKQRLQKIAEHFGWTEPTAKNNKYRCLQQLRTLLRDQPPK